MSEDRAAGEPAAPKSAAVQAALVAFEVGDFRSARSLAIAAQTEARREGADSAASAERELAHIVAATSLDKVQLAVLLACLALFVGVCLRYLGF